uniref:Uncharacterized protein n=1 Tax=Arundo donax TaxID=35708 RepID=A0A0A9F6G5_ARUDO
MTGIYGEGAMISYVNILYLQICFEITSGDWQVVLQSFSYWQMYKHS